MRVKPSAIIITTSGILNFGLYRGKFAVVKKCTDKRTGCVYAAKFLRKRRRAVSCREEIIIEIDIMRQAVSHPGVVQLQEVYESQREIVIILEM